MLQNKIKIKKSFDIGIVEFLLAMYPVLIVYRYAFFPFSLFILLLMDVILLSRGKRMCGIYNKGLKYLFAFVLVHELLLFVIIGLEGVYITKYMEYLIIFSSILLIYPNLNIYKLINALNIIAALSMIGLVYQFIMIKSGHIVYPISLPFLPQMDADSKLYVSILRPTSFFYEPQHYCSFMLVPLFFALIRKKTIWAIVIIFSIFLSTSSYGILMTFIVLATYFLLKKGSFASKIGIVVGSVLLVYILLNSSLFESSVEKIENTDIERTSRLYNGPELIQHMPFVDMILGVPYFTAADYYFAGNVNAFLIEKNNNIYLPSIYLILVKFGIFGLALYLISYFKYMFKKKELWLLGGAIFAGLFSNPDALGAMFAFYIIIIYSYLQNYKTISNESVNYNNSVY